MISFLALFFLMTKTNSVPEVDKSKLITLYTEWGEKLNKNEVLLEYPRPQFERDSYMNLNGVWHMAITDDKETNPSIDTEIVVPFSPETPLSGVQKQLLPGNVLWYERDFDLSGFHNKGRILLHFGAVDQFCEIFINDKKAGEHDGGYLPFDIDITEFIVDNKIKIRVRVVDDLDKDGAAYGKQKLSRGGIWYTATSGIWQTVWLESVPSAYLNNVKITPLFDLSSVEFIPEFVGDGPANGKIFLFDGDNQIAESQLTKGEKTVVAIDNFKEWTPENPFLYTIKYEYNGETIKSYFAMRKFSIDLDKDGYKRLFLNNKPYFQKGLLDQGYWSDGYYTAPSDEAIIFDITKMKKLGFNMLRKHIKIEPLRWYYHCDRLGMLVWQDAVSGGGPYSQMIISVLPFIGLDYISDSHYSIFGRSSEIGRKKYYRDLRSMINHLYNAPCICTWVPFNEAWGQFDAKVAVDEIKKIDQSRFIDHASGWHDQGVGDFRSLHVYFKSVRISGKDKYDRAIVLSEFGGYSYGVDGHVGSTSQFGYSKYKSKEDLNEGIKKLFEKEIIPQIQKGLSATVYTQVSDVEDEVNGLLTFDRKVCKADDEIFININNQLVL
ncbi:hypothetical protein M9Y10_030295 [Tritrichomonas musculus]|uniref:Beta-galactosidase n=1 Tax=Tritrichomonas musculus TaxID=1915356 RepID=A0ABR2KPV5_9EUKA